MTLKRKLLFVTGISLIIVLAGCGKKDPADFREYQPLEMTQSVSDQPDKSGTTKQESADSDDSSSQQQLYKESEQPVESGVVSGSEDETAECAVTVDYASALMYYNPDSYHECILDHSAYATQIGFEVAETVSDVSVLSLSLTDVPESGELLFDATVEYSLPELTPDMPLVVSAGFGETIPTLGISFLDPNGDRKVYGITMSGEDQSILLNEIQLAR
ncbi:MAG: hypothetical protein ACI4FY_07630 [Acetatifactor sp.]